MIRWQLHTAYDFFISLFVLHHPKDFALRASWAAGVRQRLDEPHRQTLEMASKAGFVPLTWLATLPDEGDAESALDVLASLPAEVRFERLFASPEMDEEVRGVLESLRRGAEVDEAAKQTLRSRYRRARALREEELSALIRLWRHPAENADAYLEALRAYWRVFFAEEEQRIRPFLEKSLAEAQNRAEKMTLPDLLNWLSRGVRLLTLDDAREMVLAPSFWAAPLIFTARLGENKHVFVFGARPETANLVPGVSVPDELVSHLKALADATRLRILKSLLNEPATVTELARQLRLRPPTVVHHLRILRLSGLVQITINSRHERIYALRAEGLLDLQQSLMYYLSKPK